MLQEPARSVFILIRDAALQWGQKAAMRLHSVASRLGGRLSKLRGPPKAIKPLPLGVLKLTLKSVEIDPETDVPASFLLLKCGPHWGRTVSCKASKFGKRPVWDWQVRACLQSTAGPPSCGRRPPRCWCTACLAQRPLPAAYLTGLGGNARLATIWLRRSSACSCTCPSTSQRPCWSWPCSTSRGSSA